LTESHAGIIVNGATPVNATKPCSGLKSRV
jgi:hypothetical protein